MERYSKQAEGVISITLPSGATIERKTATCAHCDKIVFVQPGTDGTSPLSPLAEQEFDPPAVCHICWALVCADCHRKGTCTPLEERLRKIEAKSNFYRAAGLE